MNIEEIFVRGVPGVRETLKKATIGLAGCGGLGSNIAISLVRAGLGSIITADYDKIELSNLNRQQYLIDDVGKDKTEALKSYLLRINPELNIVTICAELTPHNIVSYFLEADLMIEAFDAADKKKWLIDVWLRKTKKPIVCGSGVSGYGKSNEIKLVKNGNLFVCGDQKSEMTEGLCSARVAMVANMQANTAIEILMQIEREL